MAFQRTLKHKVSFTGIGLHSGRPINLTVRPAEPGTGIVFHRVDLAPAVSIEALAKNVVNTRLSTTIGVQGAVVSTIEHLMAALVGCCIDNAHVDIDGPEVPILDGSAAPFVAAFQAAGSVKQGKPRRYLVVRKPVTVSDGDKKVTILPSRSFKVSFSMSFSHPAVPDQSRSTRVNEESVVRDFAAARTFGFLAEVEFLKANGLALGGSLENAVVIGDQGVLNPEGLRYDDEFVRHKILDAIGDLSLAGYALIGHVKAHKSGHDLNHRLVQELLARPDAWRLVEFTSREEQSGFFLSLPELAWSEA